eukprot:scaffold205453_cov31-Prasinocladus_malaysianus.AAC.1
MRPTKTSFSFVKPNPPLGMSSRKVPSGVLFVFFSGTNFPRAGAKAAVRLKPMRKSRNHSVSRRLMPVSRSNCARGPLPLTNSPSSADPKPSIAMRPTKISVDPHDSLHGRGRHIVSYVSNAVK